MPEYGSCLNTEMEDPEIKHNSCLVSDQNFRPNLKYSLDELTPAGIFAILCKRFQKTLTYFRIFFPKPCYLPVQQLPMLLNEPVFPLQLSVEY